MRLVPPNRDDGPSLAELAVIKREWPLIEAEMALVAAEIDVLTADPQPTVRDWHRLRTAERRVLCEVAALVSARLNEAFAA